MTFFLRFVLRLALTFALLWFLADRLPQMFIIGGGYPGLVIVAAVLTVLNALLRPILNLITLPFRLVAKLLTGTAINVCIVWLTLTIVEAMGKDAATFQVTGGVLGWVILAVALGLLQLVP